MSGVIGSKLNIRGSGLVGSLGTDGQHLLSSGAGKTNVFESAAAGGKLLQCVAANWTGANTTTSSNYSNVDTTNAKVVITPTSATARILCYIFLNSFMSANTSNNASISIRREVTSDASDLFGDDLGSDWGLFHTWTASLGPGSGVLYDDYSTNDPGLVSLTYRARFKMTGGVANTVGRAGDWNQMIAFEIEAN